MNVENKGHVGTGIFGLFRREVKILDKGEGEVYGDNPPNHDQVSLVYEKGPIAKIISRITEKRAWA